MHRIHRQRMRHGDAQSLAARELAGKGEGLLFQIGRTRQPEHEIGANQARSRQHQGSRFGLRSQPAAPRSRVSADDGGGTKLTAQSCLTPVAARPIDLPIFSIGLPGNGTNSTVVNPNISTSCLSLSTSPNVSSKRSARQSRNSANRRRYLPNEIRICIRNIATTTEPMRNVASFARSTQFAAGRTS